MAKNDKNQFNGNVVALAALIAILGALIASIDSVAIKIVLIFGQLILAFSIGYSLKK